jgi:hypothetical protein
LSNNKKDDFLQKCFEEKNSLCSFFVISVLRAKIYFSQLHTLLFWSKNEKDRWQFADTTQKWGGSNNLPRRAPVIVVE